MRENDHERLPRRGATLTIPDFLAQTRADLWYLTRHGRGQPGVYLYGPGPDDRWYTLRDSATPRYRTATLPALAADLGCTEIVFCHFVDGALCRHRYKLALPASALAVLLPAEPEGTA